MSYYSVNIPYKKAVVKVQVPKIMGSCLDICTFLTNFK